jgi:hypothetical protein
MNYTVRMTVFGRPCPITRPVYTSTNILAGSTPISHRVFLPNVKKASASMNADNTVEPQPGQAAVAPIAAAGQITTLVGSDLENGAVSLRWSSPGNDVTGYRVYRREAGAAGPFDSIAGLPPTVTAYDDDAGACGQAYYVATLTAQGEIPSAALYYSAPCTRISK